MKTVSVCVLDVIVSPALSTVLLMENETEDSNPWDLPELQDTGVPWSGKDWWLCPLIFSYQYRKHLQSSWPVDMFSEGSVRIRTSHKTFLLFIYLIYHLFNDQ